MSAAAPHAEPERRAVALRYERDADRAPHVVARGRGSVADEILRLAREHDVPVHEDPDLLELLAACEPREEIPEELYGAVAELLAWLWRLNADLGRERGAR
jgi:flagellar biosynthesis protein